MTEKEARIIVREAIEEAFNIKSALKKGMKVMGGTGLGAGGGAWLGAGLGYMKNKNNDNVKQGAIIGAAIGAPIGALLTASSRFRKAFKVVSEAIIKLNRTAIEAEHTKRTDTIKNFKTDGVKSINELDKSLKNLLKVADIEGTHVNSIAKNTSFSKINDLKKMHGDLVNKLKKCDDLVCDQYYEILDFYKYVETILPDIQAYINKCCNPNKKAKVKTPEKESAPAGKKPSEKKSYEKKPISDEPETKTKFSPYVPYWERWKDDEDDMEDNFM